jgi:hypothetical protein
MGRVATPLRSTLAVSAIVSLSALAGCASDGPTPPAAADIVPNAVETTVAPDMQSRMDAATHKVAAALRLAHQYARTADRLSRLHSLQGPAGARMVGALWQTAHAYRIAAAAAADGDLVGYHAAMRAAAISRRQAQLRAEPTRSTPHAADRHAQRQGAGQHRPPPPCAGGSVSDDPSDDACDNDDE